MKSNEFDIYLNYGFESEEDFKGFKTAVLTSNLNFPALPEETLKEEVPGFLGSELDLESARSLLRLCVKFSAAGVIVPVQYRRPSVSVDEARKTAIKEIEKIQKKIRPEGEWEPVRLTDEGSLKSVFGYQFTSVSPSLRAEGYTPGSVSVRIDKLSGDLLGDKEIRQIETEFSLLNEQQ
jgi:hypothetical protein